MHHPTTSHLEAAKRVLHYVRGTLHFGIHLAPGPLTFSAFFDTDWAGYPTDRKSTTRMWFFLVQTQFFGLPRNNPLFSVLPKRQSIVPWLPQ